MNHLTPCVPEETTAHSKILRALITIDQKLKEVCNE